MLRLWPTVSRIQGYSQMENQKETDIFMSVYEGEGKRRAHELSTAGYCMSVTFSRQKN